MYVYNRAHQKVMPWGLTLGLHLIHNSIPVIIIVVAASVFCAFNC